MTLHDKAASLRAIRRPDGVDFLVEQVARSPTAFIGLSSEGRPCLLLELAPTDAPDVRLRVVAVQHQVRCSVDVGGRVRTVTASLVSCLSDDDATQDTFLTISDAILRMIEGASREDDIVLAIDRLVRLLEKAGSPSTRSLQGLFAELIVLLRSKDRIISVAAWRQQDLDRYDIGKGNVRIEVKSSGRRQREHEFSLEQCVVPPDIHLYVVSLFVERSTAGVGVRDLASELCAAIASEPELVLKVREAVLDATEPSSLEPELLFDRDLAETSVHLYRIEDIPKILPPPPGVKSVRFVSDLSFCPAISVVDASLRSPDILPLLPAPEPNMT